MMNIRSLIGILGTFLLMAGANGYAARESLFENSDFSKGDFVNWVLEGEAFGGGPARGVIPPDGDVTGTVGKDRKLRWDNHPEVFRQPEFSGWVGRFANSYHPRKLDKAEGTLTSKPFRVTSSHISFLLGGGDFSLPGRLSVNLL